MKAVSKKKRTFKTTVTLTRTGHFSKNVEQKRQKVFREAVDRPKATLKELQERLTYFLCVLRVTTISCVLIMAGLWEDFSRKENIHAWLNIDTLREQVSLKHTGQFVLV